MSRCLDLEAKMHRYRDIQTRVLPVAALLGEIRQYTVPLFSDATERAEADLSAQIALISAYQDRVAYIRTQSLAMREMWRALQAEIEADIQERIDFLLATRPEIRSLTPDSVRKAAAHRHVAAEMNTLQRQVTEEVNRINTFDRQVQFRMDRLQGTYEQLSRQVSLLEQLRKREFFRLQHDLRPPQQTH